MRVRRSSDSTAPLPRAGRSIATLVALLALTVVAQALAPASAVAEADLQTTCAGPGTVLVKSDTGEEICSQVIEVSGSGQPRPSSVPSPAAAAIRTLNNLSAVRRLWRGPLVTGASEKLGQALVMKGFGQTLRKRVLSDQGEVIRALRKLRCRPDIDWPIVLVACPF
jgi:hypothetical protein